LKAERMTSHHSLISPIDYPPVQVVTLKRLT
jgi:hypothetical protein